MPAATTSGAPAGDWWLVYSTNSGSSQMDCSVYQDVTAAAARAASMVGGDVVVHRLTGPYRSPSAAISAAKADPDGAAICIEVPASSQ
jgi:hypothetical protein